MAAVLLCCALSMTLSAAAAWQAVRGHVFAPAPRAVVEAYALGVGGPWAATTAVALACGSLWTVAMLVREVVRARARRQRRRAELLVRVPVLPGEEPRNDRLVILEGERPDAWWLPGAAPRLVITTAALRRLKGRQLNSLLAHEQGHAQARHDWLLHCSAALAGGFPQVPVFAAFRDEMHRLVELNEDRGVFGPSPTVQAQVPQRVNRLLTPPDRLTAGRRLRLTAAAALVPVVPVLVAFGPGLRALG